MPMDVHDIRRSNLLVLLAETGGNQHELARQIDTNPDYLWQIITGHDGRQCGPVVARRAERLLGKPRGWMDVLHSEDNLTETNISKVREIPPQYQPVITKYLESLEELLDKKAS